MKRLLSRLFALWRETGEFDDQAETAPKPAELHGQPFGKALLMLLLLRNESLGLVDSTGSIFLELHGHDEFWDRLDPTLLTLCSRSGSGEHTMWGGPRAAAMSRELLHAKPSQGNPLGPCQSGSLVTGRLAIP